jgi:hypothetical protein
MAVTRGAVPIMPAALPDALYAGYNTWNLMFDTPVNDK